MIFVLGTIFVLDCLLYAAYVINNVVCHQSIVTDFFFFTICYGGRYTIYYSLAFELGPGTGQAVFISGRYNSLHHCRAEFLLAFILWLMCVFFQPELTSWKGRVKNREHLE